MDDQSKTPKRRSVLKLALGLSLALNLAVVGAVAGAAWRHGGPDGRTVRKNSPPSGMTMLRALEREDRRAVLNAARAQEAVPELDRAAYQAKMVAVLRAGTLDVTALEDLLEMQQDAAAARLGALSGALVSHVSAMPAERRAAYATRLEDMGAREKKKPKPKP